MRNKHLSAETFRTVVANLNQKSDRNGEKRGQLRVGFRARIELHPIRSGKLTAPLAAWTRDLSAKGIGLMCDDRLEVGTRFIVFFEGQRGGDLSMVYAVTQCRVASESSLIGARLIEEIASEQFMKLRQAFLAAPKINPNPPKHATNVPANAQPVNVQKAPTQQPRHTSESPTRDTDEVSRIRAAMMENQ